MLKNPVRYLVRKEFFGAVIWDCEYKDYIMIPDDSLEVLLSKNKLVSSAISIENNFKYIEIDNCPSAHLSFPLRTHLALTEKCNTACRHCFYNSVSSNKKLSSLPLSDVEIKKLINEMASLGCMELFIGGGEPFLRENWYEIFKYADDLKVQLFIFTNGSLIDNEIISKLNSLNNIGYLSVSMEGATEESYSVIRQRKIWIPLVKGIEKLSIKAAFPVFIRYTATSTNISQFKELVEFVSKVGNGKIGIKVRPILPAGNAIKNNKLLLDYKKYLDFLIKVRNEIKSNIQIDLSVYKDADPRKSFYRYSQKTIGFSRFVPVYDGFGGSGGYTSIYIDPYGNIQDCVMTYDYFSSSHDDNIRNNGLLYQWKNSSPILQKRNLVGNSECFECEYYIWCRGGCRSRAIYWNDDANAKDPWCFKDLVNKYGDEEVDKLFKDINDG